MWNGNLLVQWLNELMVVVIYHDYEITAVPPSAPFVITFRRSCLVILYYTLLMSELKLLRMSIHDL